MQAVRAGIRALRSSPSCSNSRVRWPLARCVVVDDAPKWSPVLVRAFSQPAVQSTCLEKQEVTCRTLDLLKSIPFIDPVKVTPTAKFKDDLNLDVLDNVEVVMALEEEFAVDIPDNEVNKFSSTAHLIDYIAAHPQAK